VMGAAPAWALSPLASAKRDRPKGKPPISASTRAPVSGPSPGKLVMIPASGCWLLRGGVLEVIGAGAGGVQLAQQGQGLAAHRLLDQRGLAHLRGAEGVRQPGGLGVDAAAAPGLAQQGPQLGEGERGGIGRGGGGGQDGAGFRGA
jgi:hypothetical protein